MDFKISSDSIGQIPEALSKAQGKIENALKDSKNPFYKSSYADLSSVMLVCKEPLTVHQLAFSSSIVMEAGNAFLVATLSHSSGEWLRSYMPLITAKNDMQSLGAAISYARRFCLAALCHVGVEEDDGEKAVDRGTGEVKQPLSEKSVQSYANSPPLSDLQRQKIQALVDAIKDDAYMAKLCTFLNVKNILDISGKDFDKVMNSLEKKVGE